jgi:hypothetical protein
LSRGSLALPGKVHPQHRQNGRLWEVFAPRVSVRQNPLGSLFGIATDLSRAVGDRAAWIRPRRTIDYC